MRTHAEAKLGRSYPVSSWSPLTVNYRTGIVGVYVVGTRADGRRRTVFLPQPAGVR